VQKNGFFDGPIESEVGNGIDGDVGHVYHSENKFPKEEGVDSALRDVMKNFGIVGL